MLSYTTKSFTIRSLLSLLYVCTTTCLTTILSSSLPLFTTLHFIQQENDLTCAHVPSEYHSPPSNPVHVNQQYILPSHTNTPMHPIHQNPSLSYEPLPLPLLSGGLPPHPYDHRLSCQPFPLYSSTDLNSVTTAAAILLHLITL